MMNNWDTFAVPESYTSKNGSLNKARALQYCLEDGVNTLRESDWILHLDEETRFTTDSLKGVLNFINNSGGHTFGQVWSLTNTTFHFFNWSSLNYK